MKNLEFGIGDEVKIVNDGKRYTPKSVFAESFRNRNPNLPLDYICIDWGENTEGFIGAIQDILSINEYYICLVDICSRGVVIGCDGLQFLRKNQIKYPTLAQIKKDKLK